MWASKNQKNGKRQFFVKLQNPHFWPLLDQNPQNKISPQKKSFRSTLRLYLAVTSCKKLEKFHALIFQKTLKNSFRIQKPQNKNSVKLSAAATSCKNQKNSIHRFNAHSKNSFWAPFDTKTSEQDFFWKNQAPSLFKLNDILNLCKKQKICTSGSGEKLQTNGEMYGEYFIWPPLSRSKITLTWKQGFTQQWF